jgi:hypothetical protein
MKQKNCDSREVRQIKKRYPRRITEIFRNISDCIQMPLFRYSGCNAALCRIFTKTQTAIYPDCKSESKQKKEIR